MTTPENAGVSLNDVINAGLQAEQNGVPVDWKQLCMTVYNVASNHIANMEAPDPAAYEEDDDQG